jgi:hypothetical protein
MGRNVVHQVTFYFRCAVNWLAVAPRMHGGLAPASAGFWVCGLRIPVPARVQAEAVRTGAGRAQGGERRQGFWPSLLRRRRFFWAFSLCASFTGSHTPRKAAGGKLRRTAGGLHLFLGGS